MIDILCLLSEHLLVACRPCEALQHQVVKLAVKAYNAALTVGRAALSDHLLALVHHLLTSKGIISILVASRGPLLQIIEPMLENRVPVLLVQHLGQVVIDCIRTLRDGVQDDVPCKSHSDLLEH